METLSKKCEVAVIGAGPAGLSAAIQLGQMGVDTVVLDEKPAAGGQLFKQIHKFFGSERHLAGVRGFEIGQRLLGSMTELGIPIHLNTTAWGIFPDKVIGAACGQTPAVFKPKAVIIATGASENSLPFPGWTLPGIMGAGAAQTLINYHRVRPGNRALVVGAGNVGLIVSYQLLQAGIEVVAVVEAMENVGGYMVHGAKIRRMGVPIHTRHTIVKAEGTDRVSRATIVALDESSQPIEGTEKAFGIDMICVAVGLSPAAELCRVLRARMEYVAELGGWVPLHNQSLLTSVDGVFVAGDVSGVEEASAAMEEGKLAAVSAAESLGQLSKEQAQLKKEPLRQSLNQLRTGPFGKMVGQKKESIFARFNEDG